MSSKKPGVDTEFELPFQKTGGDTELKLPTTECTLGEVKKFSGKATQYHLRKNFPVITIEIFRDDNGKLIKGIKDSEIAGEYLNRGVKCLYIGTS